MCDGFVTVLRSFTAGTLLSSRSIVKSCIAKKLIRQGGPFLLHMLGSHYKHLPKVSS